MYLIKKIDIVQILLVVYTILLTWILLFKMELSLDAIYRFRSLNLRPFMGSAITNGQIYYKEIIYNLIVFIPAGIYLSMLKGQFTLLQKIIPIFLYSLSIETLQYILSIGASDITDLIGNTLGGLIGILLYFVLFKILKEKTNKLFIVLSLVIIVIFLTLLTLISVYN